jgi:outer membrane lipoprotein SlyB
MLIIFNFNYKNKMKNITTIIAFVTLVSTSYSSQFRITGNSESDRIITYGGIGAGAGAIIGNQMGGDRSEKRAIGAGIGAITGAILGNSRNLKNREVDRQRYKRSYDLEVRRIESERQQNIAIGKNVTDSQILREQHEVEALENELARLEKERAEAELRAKRIRDLNHRKKILEEEIRRINYN